jgi:hypothetical protein
MLSHHGTTEKDLWLGTRRDGAAHVICKEREADLVSGCEARASEWSALSALSAPVKTGTELNRADMSSSALGSGHPTTRSSNLSYETVKLN